jgi:hypothetical protein
MLTFVLVAGRGSALAWAEAEVVAARDEGEARRARELGEPRLLQLVCDGSPIYVWPFEKRYVWRPVAMPLVGRVLEGLTRYASVAGESGPHTRGR